MYLLYLHEVPGRGRICTDMTAEREDNQIQAHAAFQCVIHALFTSVITAIITTLIVMGARRIKQFSLLPNLMFTFQLP